MDFIELRGGLTVPAETITFLCGLENRGITCELSGETLRVKGPNNQKPELSESDSTFIRARKAHLMALIAYQPPEMPTVYGDFPT
jgi:hypothetical protein